MEEPRQHYPKAPITEAVIDLRVNLPEKIVLGNLLEAYAEEKDRYPRRSKHFVFEGKMSAGELVAASASQKEVGHVFMSQDGHQVFQAGLDGFSFSQLASYDRWETFSGEARRLWGIYRSMAQPELIKRLAVRYINRIDIPLPVKDFKDYLRTLPEVSPEMDQGLSNFFMKLQIPRPEIKSTLVIQEAIIPPPNPSVVSILLDIDLYREVDVPNEETKIWDFFEDLRKSKNQVFEACITDQVRGLIV